MMIRIIMTPNLSTSNHRIYKPQLFSMVHEVTVLKRGRRMALIFSFNLAGDKTDVVGHPELSNLCFLRFCFSQCPPMRLRLAFGKRVFGQVGAGTIEDVRNNIYRQLHGKRMPFLDGQTAQLRSSLRKWLRRVYIGKPLNY